jgi:hypothetical protein
MSRVRQFGLPLAIYAATRVIAVALVMMSAPDRVVRMEALSGYHSMAPATLPADYATVMTSWDGQWYWDIAVNGYPESALGPDGQPVQTSLAFFPLYPMLVRAIMQVTGIGFEVVAPAVSLVLGGAAVLVVYQLVAEAMDRRRALACTAILCCFASAPILQAAYTESLALLLVATTLLLMLRHRYGWALLTVLMLGLTRNVTAVLIPVVALHWWLRWRTNRRFHNSEVPHFSLGLLLGASVVATVAWPLITGLVTREHGAYFATMKAWPGYTGSPLDPPWLHAVQRGGPWSWAIAVALATIFGVVFSARAQRAWGPELWGWTVSYSLYVFAATGFTTSVIRYLLLAFPWSLVLLPPRDDGAPWWPRTGLVVVSACAAGLLLQTVWVRQILVFAGDQGGWGFP